MTRHDQSDDRRNHHHHRRSRPVGYHDGRSHYRIPHHRDDHRERSPAYDDHDDYKRSHRRRSLSSISSEQSEIEMRPVRSKESSGPYQNSEDVRSQSRKIPTKVNRSCTDFVFFLVILLVMTLWAALAFTAISNFKPSSMMLNKDTEERQCGYDEEVRNKPYLYIFDWKKCLTPGMTKGRINLDCKNGKRACVADCPKETTNFLSHLGKFNDSICITKKPNGEDELKDLIESGDCAEFSSASYKVFGVCIPRYQCTNNGTEIGHCTHNDIFGTALAVIWDIVDTYPVIGAGLAVAVLISLVWMLLMRYLAGIITWLSLLACLVLFGTLTWYTGTQAYHAYLNNNSQIDTSRLLEMEYIQSHWLVWSTISGALGIAFIIILIVVVFLRKRLRIAIALIKQASRAMASLPTLIVFPLFTYILQLLGFAMLIALGIIVYSLDKLEVENAKRACISNLGDLNSFQNGSWTDKFCSAFSQFLQYDIGVYMFDMFSGMWFILFVNAFSYFVTAHAVARYFWTHKEEGTGCMAVGASVWVALRYHLGTLALGSLILTICGLIKMIIEYFQKKAKAARAGSCVQNLLRCCACCFWLVEKFMKYLNKNAYIMTAMYGKNFCRSASKAFNLIISNALRAIVLTKVIYFIIFVAKLAAIVGTSAATYFVLREESLRKLLYVHNPPEYIFAPVGAVAIGSYLLTSCLFNVYSNAVDTLFLCFLEDKKLNDGSQERPYHMPSELLMILNKRNYRKTRR